MPVQTAPGFLHPVASETSYLSLRVTLLDLRYQRRCMHVTRSLTCYDKIPSH